MVAIYKDANKQSKHKFVLPSLGPEVEEWQETRNDLGDDHLAVIIDQAVDRLDLSDLWNSYAGRGSPAYPPDVILKVILYEIRRGRNRPTEWMKDLKETKPLQWLARGLTPSLTRLYCFRNRIEQFLDQWNSQIAQQAILDEHTDASCAALDSTTLAANASRYSPVTEYTLERHLAQLDAVGVADQLGLATGPLPGWMAQSSRGRQQQLHRHRQAHQHLKRLQERNGQRRKDKRKRPEKIRVSVTDPEAVFGRDKDKTFRPLYTLQLLSDVSSSIVLAYEVLAQISDAGVAGRMLERAVELTGRKPQEIFADCAYASPRDLAVYDLAGVTLYAPWQENSFTAANRARRGSVLFEKRDFRWVPERQAYCCRADHWLEYSTRSRRQSSSGEWSLVEIYRCAPEHCMNCPMQKQCTESPEKGRTVHRGEHEELVEQLRRRMALHQSEYQKRRPPSERIFADIKEHRGGRRLSGRGLRGAKIQAALLIMAHNLVTYAKLERARQEQNAKSLGIAA